jgi:small subunit ribosomal protein S6
VRVLKEILAPCSSKLIKLDDRGRLDQKEVKYMRKYEVMYVIRTDIEQEQVQATVEKFQNIITNGNGEITKHDLMGKRRLAYEINKFRDGHYVLVHFNAEPAVVAELDRVLKITDEIIRHLIVKDVA